MSKFAVEIHCTHKTVHTRLSTVYLVGQMGLTNGIPHIPFQSNMYLSVLGTLLPYRIPHVHPILQSHAGQMVMSNGNLHVHMLSRIGQMGLSNGIPHIPLMLESQVGKMGLSNGIPSVPLMLESQVSIPSHCPIWDRCDCPMEYHMYHSCLNPTCLSRPTIPCGTDGTVQWNPMCTTRP